MIGSSTTSQITEKQRNSFLIYRRKKRESIKLRKDEIWQRSPSCYSNFPNLTNLFRKRERSFDRKDETMIIRDVPTDNTEEFGPMPEDSKIKIKPSISYGSDLLPGEAQAMAEYVQAGKRIPRRGEVGLTSDEIEKFENLGYVMSGSRHSVINAVRMRKEAQVYNAEQRKAQIIKCIEEKEKKENQLVGELKFLLSTKFAEINKTV